MSTFVAPAILLGVECTMGTLLIYDLQRCERVDRVLKWLFYGNIYTALITITALPIYAIFSHDSGRVCIAVFVLSNLLNFCFILMTLIWRIPIGSLPFSELKHFVLCAMLLLIITVPLLLYSLILSLSVYIFQSTLYSVLEMRRDSISYQADKFEALSHRQQKLIVLAAKSIFLFAVACLCALAITGILIGNDYISGRHLVFDQIINTISLYIQFAVTNQVYMKCCKYPDPSSKWCISWEIKRWHRRNLNHNRPRLVKVASNVSQGSPSTEPLLGHEVSPCPQSSDLVVTHRQSNRTESDVDESADNGVSIV